MIMMALNSQTPIVTEWRETLEFSQNWAQLAPNIEHMQPDERYVVAKLQKQDYLDAIPTREEALETLANLIEN
jgi:ssDNA-specific exonuclease RecJ